MPGLAPISCWNTARTEQFDFSVHCSNSAVCMTSVLSYKRFIIQQGCSVGSGPRYMICVTHFCTLCESNKHTAMREWQCVVWLAPRARICDTDHIPRATAFCSTSATGADAAPAGARPGRQHPKTARARAGLGGAERLAPVAGSRCRRLPCARTHPGPACALVHAHCPHACSNLASANDPNAAKRTAAFEALTG